MDLEAEICNTDLRLSFAYELNLGDICHLIIMLGGFNLWLDQIRTFFGLFNLPVPFVHILPKHKNKNFSCYIVIRFCCCIIATAFYFGQFGWFIEIGSCTIKSPVILLYF